MPTTDLERFLAYARAFEVAYWSDAWAGLAPYLAPDARHLVHGAAPLGADDRGREAMIDGLADSVRSIDRRFDVRIPEVLAGPVQRPDGVWMRFALTLRRAGLPDLRILGDHLVRYRGELVESVEEWIEPGAGERVRDYLDGHGDRLRPAGTAATPPADPRDARDLEEALHRTLVRSYGGAKSQQDIGAALAVCSDGFVLETVAMGVQARGRAEVEKQLELFFAAFPDYAVTMDGIACGSGSVSCWGQARMTWRGAFLGQAPTGRAAEVPFFCVFPCADGQLHGERFFFDLASLCDQIGLPLAMLRASLDGIRDVGARGAA